MTAPARTPFISPLWLSMLVVPPRRSSKSLKFLRVSPAAAMLIDCRARERMRMINTNICLSYIFSIIKLSYCPIKYKMAFQQ